MNPNLYNCQNPIRNSHQQELFLEVAQSILINFYNRCVSMGASTACCLLIAINFYLKKKQEGGQCRVTCYSFPCAHAHKITSVSHLKGPTSSIV